MPGSYLNKAARETTFALYRVLISVEEEEEEEEVGDNEETAVEAWGFPCIIIEDSTIILLA